jgi:hypothetical protein
MVHTLGTGLFDDEYAPVTSSIGFLRLPLDRAAEALGTWRRSLYRGVQATTIDEPFPQSLYRLDPLVGGARPRELLVETRGPWTAYFDCLLTGTDTFSTISYLSETLAIEGLGIRLVPNTVKPNGTGRYGAVQFSLYDPVHGTRVVEAINDGDRWDFANYGTPRDFEDQSAYLHRRVRDRLTPDMLIRYCLALDIDVANAAFYGPSAFLLTSSVELPPLVRTRTIAEVRHSRQTEEGRG